MKVSTLTGLRRYVCLLDMRSPEVITMTAYDLIYKHFRYQEALLEDCTDPEKVQKAYAWWSQRCVITAITPKYIRIELPNKARTNGQTISCYADYKILNGYWVVCADYDRDIDQFYCCRSKVQALFREWLCRLRCTGPHLIHTIDWR